MVLVWDITYHIKPVTERSHIIPIEKASEADEPLLWIIYGPCMGHNLPYQTHTFSLVRACWSCICRSIEKFNFRSEICIILSASQSIFFTFALNRLGE